VNDPRTTDTPEAQLERYRHMLRTAIEQRDTARRQVAELRAAITVLRHATQLSTDSPPAP
jgi:hypothetical protein